MSVEMAALDVGSDVDRRRRPAYDRPAALLRLDQAERRGADE